MNQATSSHKPVDAFKKLPLVSSLPNSALSSSNLTAKKAASSAATNTGDSPSAGNNRPLKKLRDEVRSSLKKLTGGEQNDKPADDTNE